MWREMEDFPGIQGTQCFCSYVGGGSSSRQSLHAFCGIFPLFFLFFSHFAMRCQEPDYVTVLTMVASAPLPCWRSQQLSKAFMVTLGGGEAHCSGCIFPGSSP